MTEARFELDDYSIRVLDVVKGKHGLKNRNEALKKILDECGGAYVEKEPSEKMLVELDAIYEAHKKKYPNRKITESEMNKLLGL
jgi:hypothetical protein